MTLLRVGDSSARLSLPEGACRSCGKPFIKFNTMQVVCATLACARQVPVIARKEAKAQDRQARESQKTLPVLRKETQTVFNEFIRLRDAGLPCICCGKFPQSYSLTGGEWDAGHYRSRGAAPELAFDEDNCHAQTKHCNRRAWDVASYRANLLAKIGPERLAALEGPHPAIKHTRDDMRAVRDKYRAKLRALKAQQPKDWA